MKSFLNFRLVSQTAIQNELDLWYIFYCEPLSKVRVELWQLAYELKSESLLIRGRTDNGVSDVLLAKKTVEDLSLPQIRREFDLGNCKNPTFKSLEEGRDLSYQKTFKSLLSPRVHTSYRRHFGSTSPSHTD